MDCRLYDIPQLPWLACLPAVWWLFRLILSWEVQIVAIVISVRYCQPLPYHRWYIMMHALSSTLAPLALVLISSTPISGLPLFTATWSPWLRIVFQSGERIWVSNCYPVAPLYFNLQRGEIIGNLAYQQSATAILARKHSHGQSFPFLPWMWPFHRDKGAISQISICYGFWYLRPHITALSTDFERWSCPCISVMYTIIIMILEFELTNVYNHCWYAMNLVSGYPGRYSLCYTE